MNFAKNGNLEDYKDLLNEIFERIELENCKISA